MGCESKYYKMYSKARMAVEKEDVRWIRFKQNYDRTENGVHMPVQSQDMF